MALHPNTLTFLRMIRISRNFCLILATMLLSPQCCLFPLHLQQHQVSSPDSSNVTYPTAIFPINVTTNFTVSGVSDWYDSCPLTQTQRSSTFFRNNVIIPQACDVDHGRFALPVPFSSSSHTHTHPGTLTRSYSPPSPHMLFPPIPHVLFSNTTTKTLLTTTGPTVLIFLWLVLNRLGCHWSDTGNGRWKGRNFLVWISVNVLMRVARDDGYFEKFVFLEGEFLQ